MCAAPVRAADERAAVGIAILHLRQGESIEAIAENFDLAPAAVAAALAFYFDHKDEIDKAIEDEGRRGGSQESTYVNGD